MATAPSPVYSPDYESTLVKVVYAPAPAKIEDLNHVARVPELQIFATQIYDNARTREAEAKVDRLSRLTDQRAMWGLISLLCLIALFIALSKGWPYEPEAALLACSLGLFAVFCMKIGDVKQ